ncbi:ABC transporter permease [uncultured Chitinophaga sp.]|uniref:ABC transporter permease n=1 Tax=uncultured Chitinophaga sp. TaxID=339340 RepID=UPI0025F96FCD|nr:ABC transporter permease [uncultured Chitinophaga sp.]
MIRNYFKLAWRNIWKSKGTSTINVTGLAVAVAAALLLAVTAHFQLSFNNFHENGASIYQVFELENKAEGATPKSNMPMPLQDVIKQDMPEVELSTRFLGGGAHYRFGAKNGSMGIRFVDPDFFRIFSFPIIAGSKTPLDERSNIVISEKSAVKWFGTKDVVGKQVSLKLGDTWNSYTISALIQDAPMNSDLTFGALMLIENHPSYASNKDVWTNYSTEIFVKLADNATTEGLEKHSQAVVNKYYADDLVKLKRDGAKPDADGYIKKFGGIPLSDIHFNNVSGTGGDIKRTVPYLLLLIAGFVLFIACINFINLSVARAFNRAKEIGMRKTMGALRLQLIVQLWGEAVLICLIALALGIGLTAVLMKGYNAWLRVPLTMSMIIQPTILLSIFLVFVVMTLVAGVYPALVMTRINTVQALKGSVKPGRKQYVRNSLIVVQFAFSALLICCTLVAWQQTNYLRSKPLGFNKEQVISMPLAGEMGRDVLMGLLRNKLAAQPGILGVTGADNNMGLGRDGSSMNSVISFDYNDREVYTHWLCVDYDYLQTLGIQLVAGRDFSREMASDSTAIVINETMAKQLGDKDLVNKFIKFDEDGEQHQVIGIMKDFNFKSLNRKIEPLSLNMTEGARNVSYAFVKVQPNDLPASMARVEKAWAEILPGAEFRGSFLDENVNRQYNEEKRMTQLFVAGAIITIIISCMGLFAIAIMAITQRTKEIGIRKVLGSSVAAIVVLLFRDFLKLVIVAIVIATPLAWYAMGQWLNGFAYNVGLQWWVFVLAGLSAIIIALFTVSIQSVKAALANPVKSLRSE